MTKIFQKLYNSPLCDYDIRWKDIYGTCAIDEEWFGHSITTLHEFLPELYYNYLLVELEEKIDA